MKKQYRASMKAFTWGKSFETGISEVDEQHKQLVELTNTLGAEMPKNALSSEGMEKVISQLVTYAHKHFKDEEKLMVAKGIDQRHVHRHIQEHKQFLDYVLLLNEQHFMQRKKSERNIFEFLTHWLAYHILGSDHNMTKQLDQIENGMSPSQAYLVMEKKASISTAPLLAALNTLFEQVLMSNRELSHLNKTLEMQVAERTKELQKANENLEILALTDALTGLPNRRHAIQALQRLWQESEKLVDPFSCMMIDADHFKGVNDTYGHEAGDAVLVELARELQHAVRTDDLVCRLGGDEFLIICPSTGLEGALLLAENILRTISALKVAAGQGFWWGSVSVGVAESSISINNIDELLSTADKGVYKAKRDGKKCVRTVQHRGQHDEQNV